MSNPFLQYRSRGLNVSELAQQLWCEKQVALELIHGKKETPAMIKGSERHQELFEEITPVLVVQPETFVDHLFIRCYQMWSLSHKVINEGRAREIPVYGQVKTMIVKGTIDELLMKDGELLLLETKTRVSGEVPDYYAYERVVEFQLSLYEVLLDSIIQKNFTSDDLLHFYKIKPDETISNQLYDSFPEDIFIPERIGVMASTAFETLRTLPEPTQLVVHYENQNRESIGERTFLFNEETFQEALDFVLGYWEGVREAFPVSKNLWKCEYCSRELKNKCDFYTKIEKKM